MLKSRSIAADGLDGRDALSWKSRLAALGFFLAGVLTGTTGAGTALPVGIDQQIATRTLGILTVTCAVLALARPTLGLAERLSRALRVPAGFVWRGCWVSG